ncbi:MAG TPA: prolyl oligopeptidase family serine peptidase [Usitatibacter sp.]|nr:prolyl oligopeptidase family serine peptidase [Usitatibacter sp.]
MTHLRLSAAICVLLAVIAPAAHSQAPAAHSQAPAAPDDDPYRYLEEAGDPRTQAFFADEARRARAVLDAIPGRQAMLERIRALSSQDTVVTALALGGTRIFYLRHDPRGGVALCMRDGLAGAERVLLDSRHGDTASIEWIAPSPEGAHVAFGMTSAVQGTMLRVVAVDGARLLPFEIDRVQASAPPAWHPDGRSFYFTRTPEGGSGAERDTHARVYRHVLGRPSDRDEVVFAAGVGGARDVPDMVVPSLVLPLESRFAYAIAREGARRELSVHVAEQRELAAARPRWRKIVAPEDEVLAIEAFRDDLYLLTKRGHPRHRILRMKGSAAIASARAVVPQGDSVIQAMALARDGLYLRTMVGGVDRLERAPSGLLGIRAPEFVRIPFDHGITQLLAHPRADGAVLRLQGWIEPPSVVQLDRRGDLRKLALQPASTADFSAMDEVRLYAASPDGTRVPVTLVYSKTTRLSGDRPTLVFAYGAHGASLEPRFDPATLAWLERGGVIAYAHVRGGGEYGEPWHAGGRHAAKGNTVADLVAVCDFLVQYGFTNPRKLALVGEGAGGIAVGGAMIRRPDLFAAVAARSPLFDMLRAEHAPGGPADVPEFGSAATPQGRALLREISAYHQVKDGVAYPAVLLMVDPRERRGDPWQSAKMAARLQAAKVERPVLLRVGPAPQRSRAAHDEALADLYTFALWQMGEPQFQPPPPAPLPAPAPAPAPPAAQSAAPAPGVPAHVPTPPPAVPPDPRNPNPEPPAAEGK